MKNTRGKGFLALLLSASIVLAGIAPAMPLEVRAGSTDDVEQDETETVVFSEPGKTVYVNQKGGTTKSILIICETSGNYTLRYENSTDKEITLSCRVTEEDGSAKGFTISPFVEFTGTMNTNNEANIPLALEEGKSYTITMENSASSETELNYSLYFGEEPQVTGIEIDDSYVVQEGGYNHWGLDGFPFVVSYSDGSQQHLFGPRGYHPGEVDAYRPYDDYGNSFTFDLKDEGQSDDFYNLKHGDYPVTITVSDGQIYEAVLKIKEADISEIVPGQCGENVSYTLDENGVLTISGTGDMYSYQNSNGEGGSTSPFYKNSSIKKVIVQDGITSIGEYMFLYCENLESVIMSDSILDIKWGAFQECTGLREITLSEKLGQIVPYAFYGCSSLESITIPESVSIIGDNTGHFWGGAFQNCTALKNITISEGISAIGRDSFKGCTALESVTIPASVSTVGEGAFSGCSNLNDIAVLNSSTEIGIDAFYATAWLEAQAEDAIIYSGTCGESATYTLNKKGTLIVSGTGLVSGFYSLDSIYDVRISEGITELNAFVYCANISNVSLPESLKRIEGFNGCTSLARIYIPGVTSIGSAFNSCSNLTQVYMKPTSGLGTDFYNSGVFGGCNENLVLYVAPNSPQERLAKRFGIAYEEVTDYGLAYSMDESGVLTISGDGVMYDVPNSSAIALTSRSIAVEDVKKIVINEGVKNISEGAFDGCKNLMSIEIPNSVTSIGSDAFWNCSSLTSIEIPNSITSIGDYAFSACSSLTSIEIPNSITSIGSGVFANCSNMTSIEIPNSVTSIGDYAFNACSSLTSIEMSNSVTSIGDYAFNACSSLTSIEMSNSVTSIGDYTFWNCSSLTSIEMPNGVRSIGDYAFSACSSLTSIEIPNSIRSIGSGAFENCSNTTGIEIPNSITSIESDTFWGCSSLTNIEIPNSVTSIGDYAFGNCSSLTSIEIPDSVTSIGDSAFRNCSNLMSIEISKSVSEIGEYAIGYYYEDGEYKKYDTLPTVKCYKDTVGYNYAVENGIPYQLLDENSSNNGNSEPEKVVITKIKIHAPSNTVTAGDKLALSATVAPSNATDKSVTWTSSNPAYATVDANGVVTTKTAGAGKTVTITATATDGSGVKSTFNLNIKKITVTKISLSTTTKTVKAGQKATVKAAIAPSNATNKALAWTSSNKKYATVNGEGVVTTKKAGIGKTVTITAKAKDGSGKKATIKIRIVKTVTVSSIKLSASVKTVKAGKKVTVKATINPSNASNKAVTWSSSNKKYATVSSKGVVTTKKAGAGKTVTITAKAKDGSGKKAKIKLKIK